MASGLVSSFSNFFEKIAGFKPYPYQVRLAEGPEFPLILDVPTGAGKTAVILAWLWRRRFASAEVRRTTPRRLVYCLPMRVLVEQTRDRAEGWLKKFALAGDGSPGVGLHILMGGEVENDWDRWPEDEAILIGTQDQLLSRALNRGYALSRYRWPIPFGLLNNDALWIMDEIQLMGAGLATTAQLQAFREKLGTYGTVHSLWMSATLSPESLRTVDYFPVDGDGELRSLRLGEEDRESPELRERLRAQKPLQPARIGLDRENTKTGAKAYAVALAAEIRTQHQPGKLTLVVVNRVVRAQAILRALQALEKRGAGPELLLIHSRYRPVDRQAKTDELFRTPDPQGPGRIVVATQAIEAGVDLSAEVLFTELAPWSSLVQRFGRCNRDGLATAPRVFWIDFALGSAEKPTSADQEIALPYETADLMWARERLLGLFDVGPARVAEIDTEPAKAPEHVLRRRDLLELFDTTPDLTGSDLDISRFIRDVDDNDVQVFWRTWEERPPEEFPVPDELCAVSIGRIKEFLAKAEENAWMWDGLQRQWRPANRVRPGSVLMLPARAGGYSAEIGWTGDHRDQVLPWTGRRAKADADEADYPSFAGRFVALSRHLDDVVGKLAELEAALGDLLPQPARDDLRTAARWHDFGKTHEAFQNMLLSGLAPEDKRKREGPWAKSERRAGHSRPRYEVIVGGSAVSRHHFRHELASALAMLENGHSNLSAYLAAAHHGKVRLSIRSVPGEIIPKKGRIARGIRDGDVLPLTELGGGESAPETVLDLSYMQMGSGPWGQSWLERALGLRDDEEYGPFRLAFLEAVLRVADWRGTAEEELGNE